jgi:hypothetical protein
MYFQQSPIIQNSLPKPLKNILKSSPMLHATLITNYSDTRKHSK